jgi:Ca2+-binding RTX toxin-like protein
MMLLRPLLLPLLTVAALTAVVIPSAVAKTSHHGWPRINGMLLINRLDQSRPLDARTGHDPFAGTDGQYRCDGQHLNQYCFKNSTRCTGNRDRHGRCDRMVVKYTRRHHELLGAHGNDQIYAGPNGDVIWGDYKPSGQPTAQSDVLIGGAGRDFIYASHGQNTISAGKGNDWIKAHWGRGTIDCGSGDDLLFVSRRAQKHYRIRHCERISHRTLGY